MSYEVIARKWRPGSFSELVGQEHISQTLLNALKSQRLPHALLFTGPRGTGKTSSARILAKALRCQVGEDFVPCGKCDECQDIGRGSSVNVIEIDGASNNGVEAIRELRDTVAYRPSSGHHKIYIIDEVHMLSTSAFNALLKTLEEPPEHVIFIMATTEVHKIPNTILSRCQRFDFRRIPLTQVTGRLSEICKADDVTAAEDALWMIARQGEGSLRDAQSLLDQVITFSNKEITLDKVIEVLGLTDRRLLVETIEALVERSTDRVVDIVVRVFKAGYDPRVFSQDLLEQLKNLLMVKVSGKRYNEVVDLPQVEIDQLKKIADTLTAEDIHLLFDMALKGAEDLPRAQDPRIVLEMMLLRMSAAPRIQNLLNLKAGVAVAPTTQAPSHAAPNQSAPPQNVAPQQSAPANAAPQAATMAPGSDSEKWLSLVQRIKKVNGVMGAQLNNTFLKSLDGKTLTIGIPKANQFLVDRLQDNEFQKKLRNYLRTYWGQDFQIQVETGDSQSAATPVKLKEQKQQERQAEVRKQVEDHPLVRSASEVFKTKITAIKETK
ncbi:MAG: hypothetical protein CL675_01385 [Bdellovibrionaceae bacterium]|nr:hypothetical protein [Pseudobdellovibrionaceae bacterium]